MRKKIDNARVEQTLYLDEAFNYVVTRPKRGFVAKIDVLLISDDGRKAVVLDWKTGKPRKDDLQHVCYALAVSKAFPTVKEVAGYNIYLNHGEVGGGFKFESKDFAYLQERVSNIIAMIEADKDYTPRKSPLCGWCSAPKCIFLPPVRKV